MLNRLIACIVFLCCGLSYAQASSAGQTYTPDIQPLLDLSLPRDTINEPTVKSRSNSLLFLAAAQEHSSMSMEMKGEEGRAESEYKDRMFTGNNIHKYLGIGSIGAAILTVLAPKEEDGAHEYLAKTSAVLGAGAVATGLAFHYEDISVGGGFKDPDNLHALWAGLGAIGIAMAASEGPDAPHATYGSLGAIGMMVGVRYTW